MEASRKAQGGSQLHDTSVEASREAQKRKTKDQSLKNEEQQLDVFQFYDFPASEPQSSTWIPMRYTKRLRTSYDREGAIEERGPNGTPGQESLLTNIPDYIDYQYDWKFISKTQSDPLKHKQRSGQPRDETDETRGQ